MNGVQNKIPGLTGNQLKLLALAAMTCDHVGVQLVDFLPLRIVGRLAFPIFAYMIAEGCAHTRSRGRYLGTMAALALAMQAVYFAVMGSLVQSVLTAFSMSIALVYLLDWALEKRTAGAIGAAVLAVAGAFFLCEVLPGLLPGTDYSVEYSFFGVLLPVLVYFGKGKGQKLALFTLGLTAVNFYYGGIQWFALAAVPLLALYNGQWGKWRMKYLFYIYYPAHLVIIWFLSLIFA